MAEILDGELPSQPPAAADDTPASAGPTARFNVYATVVFALVYMLANADRNILAVLLDPIKHSIHASDSAMGALGGLAFTIAGAIAAVPFARLADKGNRRNIIAAAVGFWSVMTAVTGVAGSYLQLVVARAGLAIGEAAQGPAIASMLGDTYPRRSRGMASGWITVGTAFGIALGGAIAGYMSDKYGWRSAFFVLGAPGLLVAALVFSTLREPLRGAADGAIGPPTQVPLWAGVKRLFAIRSIRRLMAANFFIGIAFGSWLQWLTPFFMRVHHMTATQAGAGYGLGIGIGAISASLIGGFVSDRLARRGERWRSYYCAACAIIGVPAVLFTLLTPSAGLSVAGLGVYGLVSGGVTSVSMAAGLGLIPHSMRGLATAAMGLVLSVLGGLGPVLVGGLNDALNHTYGQMAVRYTLLSVVPAALTLSAICFYLTARSTDEDAAAALKV
jgi:MFS family permease